MASGRGAAFVKILVLAEADDLTGAALMRKAREICPEARIAALDEGDGGRSGLFGACGADECLVLGSVEDDCAQGNRIAAAVKLEAPDVLLFPATVRGRMLSAWAAARLDTGLTADCTGLDMTPEGLLLQTRPAFGGNLTASILCRTARPQTASVRPGVFPVPEFGNKPIPVRKAEAEAASLIVKIGERKNAAGSSLQSARVIVTGGKGIGSKKGFEKLFRLAELLGGAVGATRSAVDAGWIGYEHQIGQTGVIVHPEWYLAFGVSGAVQHTTGMNASGKVLAVNCDRNALIFRYADIGVVGDWEEFADRLILEAEQKRQQQ